MNVLIATLFAAVAMFAVAANADETATDLNAPVVASGGPAPIVFGDEGGDGGPDGADGAAGEGSGK